MKVVCSDDALCTKCLFCEKKIPGFIRKYEGLLILKSLSYPDSIDIACEAAQKACPRSAINISNMFG